MTTKKRIALFSLLGLLSFPCFAADNLQQKKEELDSIKSKLAASQQKIASIQKIVTVTKHDLEKQQLHITEVSDDLAAAEARYSRIDASLENLRAKKREQIEHLRERRQQIAGMLSTTIRLRQTPELAVLVVPSDLSTQIKTSRMLGLTAISLKNDMDSLADDLARLEITEEKIRHKKERLEDTQTSLQEKKAKLQQAVSERQAVLASLYAEDSAERATVSKLQRQSKDMESLVGSLEKVRQKAIRANQSVLKPTAPDRRQPQSSLVRLSEKQMRSFASARGTLRLPATGRVSGRFGAANGRNNTWKGFQVTTVPGAMVRAPYDAEVLFTGKFLDYGNIVILRHTGNYHTLLAGLSDIDCARGQVVPAGAPVGAMGQTESSRALYVELREAGKPIDPSGWYQGMTRLAKQE